MIDIGLDFGIELGLGLDTGKDTLQCSQQMTEATAFMQQDFQTQGRRAWSHGEARCDLKDKVGIYRRQELSFVSFFKKSDEGYPLSEIKTADNVPLFAQKAMGVMYNLMGMGDVAGWALVCPPKRRHKEKNFATMVCETISAKTGMRFYEDSMSCRNRCRVNPVFEMERKVSESNIICFDDILTTGSTLHAVRRLFEGKNIIFIVGINNN